MLGLAWLYRNETELPEESCARCKRGKNGNYNQTDIKIIDGDGSRRSNSHSRDILSTVGIGWRLAKVP